MRQGLIAAGGRATAVTAGVNELRIKAGDRDNEASEDLPGAGANTRWPKTHSASSPASAKRQHADIVIVYQHNHVFGNARSRRSSRRA